MLVVGSGQFVVAVRRPTGEVVAHRRAWHWPGLTSRLGRWPVLSGLMRWLEKGLLLLCALYFSLIQQGSADGLAAASIDQVRLAQVVPARRLRLGLTLLAGLGGLVAIPTGLQRLIRLLQVAPGAPRRLALQQALLWGLGLAALWAISRLREMVAWRMHHAALHQALAAQAAGLPLEPRVVARVAPQRHPCAGTGLIWFLLLLGIWPLLCSWAPLPRLLQGFGLAVCLGLCGERQGPLTARRGWATALAWPVSWLQGWLLLPPDAAALEVALVAVRGAGSGDGASSLLPAALRLRYPGLSEACAREITKPC